MNTVFNQTTKAPDQTVEYITFKVGKYLFALPSQTILKVVATPPPSQGGMVSMGLVQLEQYSIQIINLLELLGLRKISSSSPSTDKHAHSEQPAHSKINTLQKKEQATETNPNPPFLMVFQNSTEDLCAIAVETPPDLMKIPNDTLKPVPPENRLTKALRWVSHIVIYEAGGSRHTLLILDLPLLLASSQTKTPKVEAPIFAIEPPVFAIEPPAHTVESPAFAIEPPVDSVIN
ncbi:MAG: hypothetical protein ACFB0D_17835 [Phormidesmis sp.]